ncbi:MAG: RNA polymerase factor sigma-54 [Fidelibacterota bacterium]
MKQRLVQKQIQKLAPMQLMLARLSQLGQMDLERAVVKEVEKNPLLEMEDDTQGTNEKQTYQDDPELEFQGDRFSSSHYWGREIDPAELQQEDELDFFERLLVQVRESGLPEEDLPLAEQIIGSLDENGFLRDTPLENIAYKFSVPYEHAEEILRSIQETGPPGIAARDLKECMLLQLKAHHEEPFVIDIIKKHYDDFAAGKYEKIRRELDISENEMLYARKQIAKLNPKPAAGHTDYLKKSIIPDIILSKKNGNFYISLNETGTPGVRLSPTYLKMLDNGDLDRDTKRYLDSHKQAASLFIQAIEQRKRSILAVARAIVNRQRDFLLDRREYPEPMVMKEVAADTGLDVSTISRIANGKYMQTPDGIYELRYFFSEKAGRSDAVSSSTRDLEKDLLKIVEKEKKSKPLSDEQLREELMKKGYHIARRTVSKYREKLHIPTSRERRKKKDRS